MVVRDNGFLNPEGPVNMLRKYYHRRECNNGIFILNFNLWLIVLLAKHACIQNVI